MNSNGILISRFSFWCEGRKGSNNVALLSEFVASVMFFVIVIKIICEIFFLLAKDGEIDLDFYLLSGLFYYLCAVIMILLFATARLVRIKPRAWRFRFELLFLMGFLMAIIFSFNTLNGTLFYMGEVAYFLYIASAWYFMHSNLYNLFINRFLLMKLETEEPEKKFDKWDISFIFTMLLIMGFLPLIFPLLSAIYF